MNGFLSLKKVALWLGVVIGFVYAGSLTGSFHFDDGHSIEANVAIRSLSNIPTFWTDSKTSSFIPENRVYRPLVYTFYSFCWLIGEGKTWPFHLMKMGMHLLVCLALFLIWRRLWTIPGWYPIKNLQLKLPLISRVFELNSEWAAFFLAFIFAIHPALSECVNYVAATTSLQCAMFYVWAYYLYLLYRTPVFVALRNETDVSSLGNRRFLFIALFLYFLSVASKEEGITLPAMVLVTEGFFLWAGNRNNSFRINLSQAFRQILRVVVPFALLGIILAAWIYWMHPVEGNESRGWATPFEYFMTQWRAYLWYMRLWFWPWDLNADSAEIAFSKHLLEPLALQALIGNLVVVALAWFNRKRFPALLFGIFWFYITISPASSVVVLAEAINEHRMYLAYVGFVGGVFTILLSCGEKFFLPETRSHRLGWLFALITIGLVMGVQERNRVWKNDENLWRDTVEKNPTSGRALNNLALVYMARGNFEEAIPLLNKCEQHWATYMYCPLNKGVSYFSLKKYDEAEASLRRAYSLNPRNVHVNFHLGRYYLEVKKDNLKAIAFFRTASELTGGRNPDADINLAKAYANLKKFPEARSTLNRLLQLDPQNQLALFQLGALATETRDYSDAIAAYERLLARQPNQVQGWYNYGVVKLAVSDLASARKAFEKTVLLDPKSEQGWYNLAYVAEKMRDDSAAIHALKELVAINPAQREYQLRLERIQKSSGDSR